MARNGLPRAQNLKSLMVWDMKQDAKRIFFDLDPVASLQFFHVDLQMETLR